MLLMNPEYILKNVKIYERHLKNSSAHKYFMNQISTDYIRFYKAGNKLEAEKEKEVINKLKDYFTEVQEFRRCAQLQRILEGEPLSEKYAF